MGIPRAPLLPPFKCANWEGSFGTNYPTTIPIAPSGRLWPVVFS